MGINDLLDIFEKFGWSGVVGAIVVIGLYYAYSYASKNAKKEINNGFENISLLIANQNKELVHAITSSNETMQSRMFDLVNTAISRNLTSHDNKLRNIHSDSIRKRLQVSEEINDILWELMNHYNCQRSILIEFHNSKENLNGLSFLWYDIQYEKQHRGVQSISAKSRNLQASNLLPIINMVNAAPSNIVILNEEDIEAIYEKSTVLYSQFKEIHAAHIIYCGIYSYDNELIGLIALEYQEGFPYHEDLINLFDIKDKAGSISLLLNFIEDTKTENDSKDEQ